MGKRRKKIKNPWLAAILNFLFPGLGFIYLKKLEFVTFGIIVFLVSLAISCAVLANPSILLNSITWTVDISLSLLWAVLGYISAEYVNELEE